MTLLWQVEERRPIDIISMGRVAVDLYAEQIGSDLVDAETFKKYLGGCAGNIAVGCARLGLQAAMFSCVGTDAMGQFLKQELQREKIDITLLKETNKHLTGLVLLGVKPPDRFPLIFYRENCADMTLQKEDVDADFFAKAKALLITGTGLSTESMQDTTHHAALVAKNLNTRVIIDLDYRPVLWGLTDVGNGETRYQISKEVSIQYQKILPICDLIVGTEEEILIAGNAKSLRQALLNIRALTLAPIIVKRGAEGSVLYLKDLTRRISSQAYPVKILNVLGAGDAFISGFLRGLLHQESLENCINYANACGAIVVTRHGCAPAMPSFVEMKGFIDNYEQESVCPTI